ncbi:MAG: hypothetical protein H0W73_08445 [Bacteroidetes bacterium]|nr:hypothetical protein [Bacteroidota bacterium]
MKKHFFILTFCFCFVLFKAQDKSFNLSGFTNCTPKSVRDFRFTSIPLMNVYSQKNIKDLSIKTQLPPLPFFCNMEEKCRGRLSFFLKLRAGNDESYMRMISPNK